MVADDPGPLTPFEHREREREVAGDGTWSFTEAENGFLATYEGRVPRSPAWGMVATFDLQRPGTPMVKLTIEPAITSFPRRGIAATVVRGVPFDALRTEARVMARLPPTVGLGLRPDQLGPSRVSAQSPYDDLFFAQWAARYVNEQQRGHKPVVVLAEAHCLSPATIRNYLQQARDRGLLTEAPPGRAGGDLTDKARDLLRDQEDD
jgi:hypothetical protein